jgi:serine/threonine protein kinase
VNVLGRPSDAYISNVRKINCQEALLALPATDYVRKDIAIVLDGLSTAGNSKRSANPVTPGASGVSPSALRLIDGLLVYDPAERLTALDCLRSSYFHASLSDSVVKKALQSRCSTTVSPFAGPDFDFEQRKLSFDDLRSELLSEAKWYEPPDSLSEHDSQMVAYNSSTKLHSNALFSRPHSCEESLNLGNPSKNAEHSSDTLLSSSASIDAGEKRHDKFRFGMFCAAWSADKETGDHCVSKIVKNTADSLSNPENEASHPEFRMCILL